MAVACKEKDDRRIVLCHDWRTTTAFGSADIMLKQRHLPHSFVLLTAGLDHEILACKTHIFEAFKAVQAIDETNIVETIRSALAKRKKEKIDEYVRALLGISYDEFMKIGKTNFPESVVMEAFHNILALKLDACFIIAGFQMGQFPLLVETDENGLVKLREDYIAIGSGSHLAMAALLSREQNDTDGLDKTIYSVFEAKQYAEKILTVGNTTTMTVMYPDASHRRVDGNGKKFLEAKYKQFGPQQIDPKFTFDQSFLDAPTTIGI